MEQPDERKEIWSYERFEQCERFLRNLTKMRRVDRAQALTFWGAGGNFNIHPFPKFQNGTQGQTGFSHIVTHSGMATFAVRLATDWSWKTWLVQHHHLHIN